MTFLNCGGLVSGDCFEKKSTAISQAILHIFNWDLKMNIKKLFFKWTF